MRQQTQPTLWLLLLWLCLPLRAMAYSGEIGTEAGWLTDTDGSITGKVNTVFLWVNEANFPDENFRNHLRTSTTNTTADGNVNSRGKDGVLTQTEVISITSINVKGKGVSSMEGIRYFSQLKYLYCSGNSLTTLDVSGLDKMIGLYCGENSSLSSLDVSGCTSMNYLDCNKCNLTELDLSTTRMIDLNCDDNQLTSIIFSPIMARAYCRNNQLKELDMSVSTKWVYLFCDNNQLTTLEVPSISWLYCTGNGLSSLKLTAVSNILDCSDNCLTELDMSAIVCHSGSNSPQNPSLPVLSLKGRTVLGVKCQTSDGKLSNYDIDGYTVETIDGDNYIILNDETTSGDQDWYRKSFSYLYDTEYVRPYELPTNPNPIMTVNVTTSPYVMYLNPRAKTGDNYYGTLYLPYKAAVPEGARVYYASGLTADEELQMTEIPAGKAIPAYTPIYVEGTDGSGYYPFYEAGDDADEAVVGTNYLTGTLEPLTVTAQTVLTLGHNSSRGELGFWTYWGTAIPGHRAYVSADALAALGGSAKGLTLRFDHDGQAATAISAATAGEPAGKAAWHTLQGIRLDSAPAGKGIYIEQGKKKVVR